MIQVCSRCGTRWNVRDRQRQWCPRCQGALLAPSGYAPGSEWSARSAGSSSRPGAQDTPPRLPAGYRWIAVRPGAAPPPRRRRGPLGPTPRYASVPRWGLVEDFEQVESEEPEIRRGPSPRMVRRVLVATMVAFGAAALMMIVRYALLLINRSTLLNPWLADGVIGLGVLANVLALFLLIAAAVVLTNWLIARRAAAFQHNGQSDPRPARALRVGCLVPFVNLLWAPVFVMELARVEHRLSQLRRPIAVWWILWVLCTFVSAFAFATSFATSAQGRADNTVTTAIALLLSVAVLLLTLRVYEGFERTPVERPARRWVVVADEYNDRPQRERTPDLAVPVESQGQHPAA